MYSFKFKNARNHFHSFDNVETKTFHILRCFAPSTKLADHIQITFIHLTMSKLKRFTIWDVLLVRKQIYCIETNLFKVVVEQKV